MELHKTKFLQEKDTIIEETIYRMGENICYHISNKEFMPRIHKPKKFTKQSILKYANDLNGYFSKEIKIWKNCSMILAIREIENKITMK